jgi:transposase
MFDRVKMLQAEGQTTCAIVKETRFNWRTVSKWMPLKLLPPRRVMAPKTTSPVRFSDHLAARWSEGCTTGRHLLSEIRKLGYKGSLTQLERLLTLWRRADHVTARPACLEDQNAAGQNFAASVTSIIAAAALCIKPRGQLTDEQVVKVARLKEVSPDFKKMREPAMRFRGILHGSNIDKLDVWLDDADCSGLYKMRRFARTLRQDLSAVRNAITEVWSNGQTEGQINRLKILKRSMYGQAGLELLRARMLAL